MRVLVADDHSLFRDGICSLLEASGFEVVGQVGDGQAAVEKTMALRPELVLLDIHMPPTSGLDALEKIKRNLPQTKVVMLTVSSDDADLMRAASAGADGYLLKSLAGEEFLALLEGLKQGEAAMTRKTTMQLMKAVAASRQQSHPDDLTRRERELLRLVADGMSNKAIAQQLSVSENTVKYHMKNILQKMGAQNRTEAVTQAVKAGLLDPTDAP